MCEIISCPQCKRKLHLPEEHLEHKVQCPSCDFQFNAKDPFLPPPPPPPIPPANKPLYEAKEYPSNKMPEFNFPPPKSPQRPYPGKSLPKKSNARPKARERSVAETLGISFLIFCGIALFFGFISLLDNRNSNIFSNGPNFVEGGGPFQKVPPLVILENQFPVPEAQAKQELNRFFADLGQHLQFGNPQMVATYFDIHRFLDVMIDHQLVPQPIDQKQLLRNLYRGMNQEIGNGLFWVFSKNFEITHLKQLKGTEVVVMGRHDTLQPGRFIRTRYWLTKRCGKWKIYDVEDLDTGLRMSTLGGTIQGFGITIQARNMAEKMQVLQSASLSIQQQPVFAQRDLEQLGKKNLPVLLEAQRLLSLAIIHTNQGRYQDALALCKVAAGKNPDIPVMDYLQGIAYCNLKKYQQSIQHMEVYKKHLGLDNDVCFVLGSSYQGLQRLSEARKYFRLSLKYKATDNQAFHRLLNVLGVDGKRDDLGKLFLKLNNPADDFHLYAENRRLARDPEGLKQLALAMRKLEPRSPSPDYYLSLTHVWENNFNKAIDLIKTALKKERHVNLRRNYQTGFIQAMVNAGKAVEAYRALPNPQEIFPIMAENLITAGPHILAELINAHRQKYPQDKFIPFYEAEVHIHNRNYQLADRAFTKGMKNPPPDKHLKNFDYTRVLARFYTGNIMAAYKEVGKRHQTFSQLAGLCVANQKYEELEKLVGAHQKYDPSDRNLLRYRYRLLAFKKHTDKAIKLFQKHFAKEFRDNRKKQLVATFIHALQSEGMLFEAYQGVPNARMAFAESARSLKNRNQWGSLKKLVKLHSSKDKNDPELDLYKAELLAWDFKYDKAADHYEQWWKEASLQRKRSSSWRYEYIMHKCGRGLKAYAQSENRNFAFSSLARLMIKDRQWQALNNLIVIHRKKHPGDPEIDFYSAKMKIYKGEIDAAIPIFLEAYNKQQLKYKRNTYHSNFLVELQKRGHGLKGYLKSPDKKYAFNILANQCILQKKDKDLEKLIEIHHCKHEKDCTSYNCIAQLHLLRNQNEQALAAYLEGLKKNPHYFKNRYHFNIARAFIRAGKAQEGYKKLGANARAFRDLAQECVNAKDHQQLVTLIALHKKTEPSFPDFPIWEVDLKWIKKDYQKVYDMVRKLRENTRYKRNFKLQNYHVTCLLRLQRNKEAIRVAEEIAGNQGDRLLLILAYAGNGDVEKVMATVKRYPHDTFLVQNCYRHTEIGPILRSEAFQEFRQRFPDPNQVEKK